MTCDVVSCFSGLAEVSSLVLSKIEFLTGLAVDCFSPLLVNRRLSLFSLSFSLGLFRVEELLRKEAVPSGFNPEVSEEIPILTLFAVEEPENHLSPHYLGRVVNEFSGVANSGRAQVLVSSHSPAILGRVAPDNVRYFLGNESVSSTRVRDIPLPADRDDESFKYVREAVR